MAETLRFFPQIARTVPGNGRWLWPWSFGVLILLLLALGSFTNIRLGKIFANVRANVEIAEPRLTATRQMEIEVLGYIMNVRACLGGYGEARQLASENASDLDRGIAEYQRLAETPRQHELAVLFVSRWQELLAHAEVLLAAGRASAEELRRLGELEFALERMIEDEMLPDASAFQHARTIATLSDLEQTNRIALLQFCAGLAIVVIASGLVVWLVLGSQEALRLSEERYRIVADFAHDWEFWIAPDGRYEHVSPSVQRITGRELSPGMAAEDFLRKVVHPEDLELHLKHLQDDLQRRIPADLEFRILLPDGSIRWIHHVSQPAHDQMGRFLGTRGSNRDITDRKQAEIQLEESLHNLREAQQELMRRERIATLGQLAGSVAHHIRTPLAVIQNSIFFLEHSPSPSGETMREVLAEMKRAIRNSDRIMTAMLDFVREPSPCPEIFPIGDAVSSALQHVPLPATIRLQDLTPLAAGLRVWADRDQVTRILVNLFQNALDAMPLGGELELNARHEDDPCGVCIQVRDAGCGIPEEYLGKIFDPLFSTKVSGIGLGLALARRYAELNGGHLSLESKVGCGTTFRLVIPAQA